MYSSQKYNRWNADPDVTNHHHFLVDGAIDRFTSNFKPVVSTVTIKNELIEIPSLIGGAINFKDPWYLGNTSQYYESPYGYRNLGSSAILEQRSSPFNPNTNPTGAGSEFKGVFLNQAPDPNNPSVPYYSVNAPSPQTLGVYNSSFVGWTATNSTNPAQFSSPLNGTSAVIFKSASDFIIAKYKGQLISTTNAAVASNSQRKIVKTVQSIYSSVDKLFTAYESAGGVFFLYKDLSDGSWSNERVVEGLPTATIQYRSPTLFTDSAAQKFFMLYDKVDLAANTHKIQFSAHDPIDNSMGPPQTLSTLYLASTYQTTPVVASVSRKSSTLPPLIAAAWCNQNKLGFALGTAVTNFGVTSMQFTSIGELTNPPFPTGSFIDPANIAVAVSYAGTGIHEVYVFHLVWEEPGETGGIKYARGTYTGTAWPPQLSSITWSGPQTYYLAQNNTTETELGVITETFTKPSIAVDANRNVFVAYQYRVVDEENMQQGQVRVLKWDGTNFPPIIDASYSFPSAPVYANMPSSPSLSDYRYSSSKTNDVTLVYHANNGTTSVQYYASQLAWSTPSIIDATGRLANVQGSVTTSDVSRSVVYMGSTGAPYAIKTASIPVGAPILSGSSYLYNNSYRPQLNWTATGNTYKLYRYICPNNGVDCNNYANQVLVYQGSATMCIDYGVIIGNSSSNSKIYYYVYAYDASNQSSPSSNKVSFLENIVQKTIATVEEKELPTETKLVGNYPNPFNPVTTFNYQLAEPGVVTLTIYNLLGQEVTKLVNSQLDAGYYTVTWNAENEGSGLYYARMTISDALGRTVYQDTKKVLLAK